MTGKLLGHMQIQTTARYPHLANESVKVSGSRVADSIGTHITLVVPQRVTSGTLVHHRHITHGFY